jgi:uncharacterized protein YjgD (DUF1641 family)
MGAPIRFQPLPRDPREELHSKLEAAPLEHAQALFELYDILQGLHDRGILAALKGVLSASDFVVETAKTPEAVRSVRNVILLTKMLGSIEPEVLEQLIDSVPEGLAKASAPRKETPGLFSLAQKLTSQESRRGLAVAAEILEIFGKRLAAKSAAGQQG